MRVLILGGTTEAAELAGLMAGDERFDATLSLAGRTASPRPQSLPIRVGGFGGADALARWLRDQKVDAVIDATHPYAAQISANAVVACTQAGVALGSIVRAA
jgi:precorrin-6A/cobalt-precorrin-6A reductase